MAANNFPNTDSNLLANIVPAASMSTLGFVYDSVNKFDIVLSHAFVADYNQTYLYPGNITSMSRLIQKAGSDITALITSVKNGLYAYLNKYYEEVEVNCSIAPNGINPESNAVTFQLEIKITEGLSQTVYGRLVSTVNSRLTKIIALNNYG